MYRGYRVRTEAQKRTVMRSETRTIELATATAAQGVQVMLRDKKGKRDVRMRVRSHGSNILNAMEDSNRTLYDQ